MNNDLNINVIEKTNQIGSLYCATIELLTACNWRCQHCFIPEHDSFGLLKAKIISILEELRAVGCFKIVFTGGEIFLRQDCMEIIEIARNMNFEVILFTNISLLDEEKIRKLAELYISQISCTIFSLDYRIHDYISSVKDSFQKVIRNVHLIKHYGIPLEIKTILTNKDPFAYRKLEVFCKKYSIDYLVTTNICAKTDCDSSPKQLSLSFEQLEIAIPEIDKILNLKRNPIPQSNPICNSIQYSCFIDSQGKVYPCNNMLIEVGDLNYQSFADVWYNSDLLKSIKSLKVSDLKYCSKCDLRESCDRCAGIIFLEEQDLLGKSTEYCKRALIRNRENQK